MVEHGGNIAIGCRQFVNIEILSGRYAQAVSLLQDSAVFDLACRLK
jgi:hypothetical protein